MWLTDADCCGGGPVVTQFATYVYAKAVADDIPDAEVHRHPSGIGWAVYVRVNP